MAEQKKKLMKKKADKKTQTKLILSTDEQTEEELDVDEDEAGGIYLEKEDVLLIYKALKHYKPVNMDEEMLSEVLLEQFEEILIVDYKVKLRRSGW